MSPNPPEFFVDGASTALLAGGAVRLDLEALETSKRSLRDEQSAAVVARLVLSPAAFLQMVESVGAFLAERGIEPVPAGPAGGAGGGRPSPNFGG